MKIARKEMPLRQAISTATSVEMTKEFYKNSNKRAARYSNTTAANLQNLQVNSSTIVIRVKAEFIRIAVWLSVLGGS